MAGPSQSRLEKAGGNAQLAAQMLDQEFQSGAKGWSPEQIAAYTNPATRDAFIQNRISHKTKGKFSGPLGAIGKAVSTVAPYALPLIPGLGPLAAAGLSAGVGKLSGKSLGSSLTQGAMTGIGSALLGGQGYKGIGGAIDRVGSFAKNSVLPTIGKTFTTSTGGIDLNKIAGLGIGASSLIGAGQQRKTAQARLGAEDQVRNQLLARLLERPNYDFSPSF